MSSVLSVTIKKYDTYSELLLDERVLDMRCCMQLGTERQREHHVEKWSWQLGVLETCRLALAVGAPDLGVHD